MKIEQREINGSAVLVMSCGPRGLGSVPLPRSENFDPNVPSATKDKDSNTRFVAIDVSKQPPNLTDRLKGKGTFYMATAVDMDGHTVWNLSATTPDGLGEKLSGTAEFSEDTEIKWINAGGNESKPLSRKDVRRLNFGIHNPETVRERRIVIEKKSIKSLEAAIAENRISGMLYENRNYLIKHGGVQIGNLL